VTPTTEDEPPSLYAWAGGTDAFRRLIDAFYDRVEADDLLSPLFPGGVSQDHRAHVVLWWVEVFGGPADYTPLGGYQRMLDHHRGLGITVEQRFRFASLMSLAADDAGLPDDPYGLCDDLAEALVAETGRCDAESEEHVVKPAAHAASGATARSRRC